MQLKLRTIKLQELVSKSVKGASGNKMIPITGLMCVQLEGNKLTLTTTDATNYLEIIEDKVEGEDFYVTVPVDVFSKLVSKTTSENIILTLEESCLKFKGNGNYSIELPLDEEGAMVRFPKYKFDSKAKKFTVNLSTIKTILSVNKSALAVEMDEPHLTGYYCDENCVITTDTFKVCGNNIALFNTPVLVPSEVMDLLALMTEEKITAQVSGSKMLFTTSNVVVYGVQLENIEKYPVEAVKQYLETEFTSCCKLPKALVMAVFERLSLFVTEYDKNGIYMTFTKDGVSFSSKQSTGTEMVSYSGSTGFKDFTCCADITLMTSQIKVQETDTIELWYAHEQAIKMVNGKVTQIVSLLEDDRYEGTNGEDD